MQNIDTWISMYPYGIRILYRYAAETCDRLDYDHSPIYDEYPDPLFIDRICDSLCDRVLSSEDGEMETLCNMWGLPSPERGEEEQMEAMPSEQIEVQEMRHPSGGRPSWGPPPPTWGRPSWGLPPKPPGGRPPWGRPPRPPKRRPPWLRDWMKVLFLDEMHRKRCRRGMCSF